MLRQKNLYLLALLVVGIWTYYMFVNKEYFIQEHLTNNNPTLFTLQSGLDDTNTRLAALNQDVQNMKSKAEAQGQQAAAAQASLQAIPMGANTILPTR
jgi:type VI protein secretion system component VasK